MRHLYSGRKLKRTNSHRKALLMNLATALLEHKRIQTTEIKAKELRPFVEQIITRAKNAYVRERAGQLPNGQTIDIHARRVAGRIIRNKAVLQELFDTIAPVVENRNGGYTRIVKLGQRRGDGSRTASIELVDFHTEQDGVTSLSRTKKRRSAAAAQPAKVAAANALEQSVAAAVTTIESAVAAQETAEPEVAAEEVAPESTTDAPSAETNDAPSAEAPESSAEGDVAESDNAGDETKE